MWTSRLELDGQSKQAAKRNAPIDSEEMKASWPVNMDITPSHLKLQAGLLFETLDFVVCILLLL